MKARLLKAPFFLHPSSLIPHPCSSSLFPCGRSALRLSAICCKLARILLADACSLAAQFAQIVELGTTHAATLDQINVVNNRRMKRKDSLDADAETGLPDSDRLTRAAVLARNHDAFKYL